VQHRDDGRFFEAHDRALRGGDSRRHAQRLTGKTSLAKKVADTQDGEDRFFALLGQDPQLDLAFLDVEDGICRVSLRKDHLPPTQPDPGFPDPTLAKKSLGSKGGSPSAFIQAAPL
jgi:hypothetical protein